ncbi:MAG TPA: adenylate/guanylate cyclase domain-containing protein, partial [Alphaproteobacteria bacterium]
MADATDHRGLEPIRAWLTEAGLANLELRPLLEGLCTRLVAAGVPVARAYLSTATLHPLLWATGVTWENGRLADEDTRIGYGYEREAAWRESPFRHMLESDTPRLRRRLTGREAALDFPVLAEFRDDGLTDWLAHFHAFGWALKHQEPGQLGVIFSWATDRPEGWSEPDLAALDAISKMLALTVKAATGRGTTRALLATYLGQDAAERVITGQVQRGSVTRVNAFILYADLRGFTDFADATPPEEVTRRLNAYFDCLKEPIAKAGGEILKFMGDGVLALFLTGAGGSGGGDHSGSGEARRDRAPIAAAALDAAEEILARAAKLDEAEAAAGHPPLGLDIALHEGEVTYGNVGTEDRLDFTVIGPAVNEASRLEGLCKELGLAL